VHRYSRLPAMDADGQCFVYTICDSFALPATDENVFPPRH